MYYYCRAYRIACNHVIDGHLNATEVAQLFAGSYRDFYSSISYDHDDMADIVASVTEQLQSGASEIDCQITSWEFKRPISALKKGKGDAANFNVLSSDHLTNASDDLHVCVSLLFSSLISHGFILSSFLCITINPIAQRPDHDLSPSDHCLWYCS